MISYLALGFLLPLVLSVLIELIYNKLRIPKEVERLSSFPLIGSLRHVRSQNPTLVQKNPRSSYTEMLRTIRTKIEFIVGRKQNIVLSITSTQSGDGKTFLATNLAALYGMTGKKTLLIDLDIRKPNIHEKLGVDAGLGVTNYLIGECEIEDILHKDTSYNFDFLLAGTIPPNPGELIRTDKLVSLLQELRKQYDFIIIDTSPIGQVPDAFALIEQTDLTLYVIRCMQTNKYFCKNTLQQMEADYKDKVQLVFSDMPVEKKRKRLGRKSYGYAYNSYGYGYGYGYGGKNDYNYYSDDE